LAAPATAATTTAAARAATLIQLIFAAVSARLSSCASASCSFMIIGHRPVAATGSDAPVEVHRGPASGGSHGDASGPLLRWASWRTGSATSTYRPFQLQGYGSGVRAGTTRPLIFVDIDGVLIPFRARSGGTRRPVGGVGDAADGTGKPLLDRLDPADGGRPLALPGELVWASTWRTVTERPSTPLPARARAPIASLGTLQAWKLNRPGDLGDSDHCAPAGATGTLC